MFEALQYRLASMGIVIAPYYWIQEGVNDIDLSQNKADFENYTFGFFGPDEMKQIVASEAWGYAEDQLLARLEEGEKCFGAKYHGEIVAFMWVDLEKWFIKKHRTKLGNNEAYLFDMYIMKPFRGKGIAPYLRYQSYRFLKKTGRDRLFSYSDYFNNPSIRCKKFKRAIPESRLICRIIQQVSSELDN
ncbi:MAG TPA: GNAT family N-acetyltransferase [Acidobacteriota bacterium]|nr:GNAT family N-acetyltransferase [Acidobacteriota bacterium]